MSSSTLVGEDLERLAVGQRAALQLNVGGPVRVIPGVVERVRSNGVQERNGAKDTAMFTMRLVPALALLRHQRGSRIFQDLTVPQVVTQVLDEARIATRWNLTRRYASRSFITQYEESDLAFVQRLLAEAGIFYFFAEPGLDVVSALASALAAPAGPLADVAALASAAASLILPEETVCFADDASVYPTVSANTFEASFTASVSTSSVSVSSAPTLRFLGGRSGAENGTDKVLEFAPTRRVRSEVAEYRDFDPSRPQAPRVSRSGSPGIGNPDPSVAVDVSLDPTRVNLDASASLGLGGFADALMRLVSQRQLETYEHHGTFLFPDWDDADQTAALMRRQTTRNRVAARGTSLAPSLAPGHRFKLEDHPIHDHNREHVVISVEHTGRVGEKTDLYRNAFTTVPAAVPFPPRRPKRRTVQSMLTATVVGPPGEEIHVDAAGRIKVLFHWDRRGIRDDRASCWVRSVQPWGGAGYGHQFIPRVGMEVAISFEGGDPDKPIVIGSLYNATHVPSFALPLAKTQSGIRTQSSPGGGGFNELMFEDAAGHERIYIHAQRDLESVVRQDRSATILSNDRLRVEGSQHSHVEGMSRAEVVGRCEEVVQGDVLVQHLGSRTDSVAKSLDQRISAARTLRIGERDDIEVKGAAEHKFQSDLTTRVAGNHTLVIGKNDKPRSLTIHVEGAASLNSQDNLEFAAKKGITLRCGATTLRIGEDGVELVGPMIRAAGEAGQMELSKAGIKLTTPDVHAQLDDTLLMKTANASLSMKDEVRLDGKQILLNSPDKAKDAPPKDRPPPTTVRLTDPEGKPLANQRFVIELEDGSQRSGVTDREGNTTLELATGGQIRFPELTDVKG